MIRLIDFSPGLQGHLWIKKRVLRVFAEIIYIKLWLNPKVLSSLIRQQQVEGGWAQPIWHKFSTESDGSMPATNTGPL
jgi:hypothetical protein